MSRKIAFFRVSSRSQIPPGGLVVSRSGELVEKEKDKRDVRKPLILLLNCFRATTGGDGGSPFCSQGDAETGAASTRRSRRIGPVFPIL